MNKNLKAVICNLNSQYIHSSLAPWCLLSGIESFCESDITADVIEGTINEPPHDIAEKIIEAHPDVIGFCCYIWNISQTLELIKMVKLSLTNSIIVLGGPEVSYNPKTILDENAFVDYVISGEGEKPFALLLNALKEDSPTTDLPGLSYRTQNCCVHVSPPVVSSNDPPSPYSAKYFEKLKGRIAYLETSRGCPYSCAFCLSGRCSEIRFFDIERAKSELLALANSGTQTVKLVDRTFNANRKRAAIIFDFIIKNYGIKIPDGVCFHFEIAGDILDNETIDLLASAPIGAIQLEIGLQSFNEKTLKYINRKTDIQKLKTNIKRLVQGSNMHIHIDLIAGLPFEDLKSFKESFNAAYELEPHMLQLGFLKLLHGSQMRENPDIFPCIYSENAPYEVLQTPWISADELQNLHNVENALDRLYNSGRFKRTLAYILNCGYKPFELFFMFAAHVNKSKKNLSSLDDYTQEVFEYFSVQKNIDALVLRDAMVCDRIATNASGTLPKVLRIEDPNLKKAKIALNSDERTCRVKGIKRGIALLYTEPYAVYADYQSKNPITGEYRIEKYLKK